MVRISLYTAISCAMEARVCVYILGIQTIAPHTQSQGICTEVVSIRIWNNNMNTYSIWKWLWHGFISVIFFLEKGYQGCVSLFAFQFVDAFSWTHTEMMHFIDSCIWMCFCSRLFLILEHWILDFRITKPSAIFCRPYRMSPMHSQATVIERLREASETELAIFRPICMYIRKMKKQNKKRNGTLNVWNVVSAHLRAKASVLQLARLADKSCLLDVAQATWRLRSNVNPCGIQMYLGYTSQSSHPWNTTLRFMHEIVYFLWFIFQCKYVAYVQNRT